MLTKSYGLSWLLNGDFTKRGFYKILISVINLLFVLLMSDLVASFRIVTLTLNKMGRKYLLKTCDYSGHNFDIEAPANICLFKGNNRNTRKRCEICSKLTIKTSEQHHTCCSAVFIVNFEHIAHLFLVSLLLTLNK